MLITRLYGLLTFVLHANKVKLVMVITVMIMIMMIMGADEGKSKMG